MVSYCVDLIYEVVIVVNARVINSSSSSLESSLLSDQSWKMGRRRKRVEASSHQLSTSSGKLVLFKPFKDPLAIVGGGFLENLVMASRSSHSTRVRCLFLSLFYTTFFLLFWNATSRSGVPDNNGHSSDRLSAAVPFLSFFATPTRPDRLQLGLSSSSSSSRRLLANCR